MKRQIINFIYEGETDITLFLQVFNGLDIEKTLNVWKDELLELQEQDQWDLSDIEFYEKRIAEHKDIEEIETDDIINFNY